PKFERLVLCATILAGFAFRWSLSNRILTKTTDEINTTIKELAYKDIIGITIAFDGWRNIVNQELMGVVFVTSSGETLIWGAEDISIEWQRQEKVISRIRALFDEAKELNIRVNGLVTDSARAYAAARHSLSVLKNKHPLKTLVTKDDAASNDDLKLPADVKIVINRDSFWESLITLHNILRPFCSALDLMQQILRAYKKKSDSNYIRSNNSSSTSLLSNTSTSNASITNSSTSIASTSIASTTIASTLTVSTPTASIPTASSPTASTLTASYDQEQESETVIDDSMKDGITSEADFDAIINKWEELLIDEEFEEEMDDLDTEIEFLDLEMHPAENQAAK
ncbi:9138_t:CDS:2, partial [Gigaspora rosea]